MNRFKFLAFALLMMLMSNQLIGQNGYVRKMSLKDDERKITAIEIEGNQLWIPESGLQAPKGEIVDTLELLLVNGELFKTLDQKNNKNKISSNGSIYFDDKILCLDNVKLDGEPVSVVANREDLSDLNQPLNGTLTIKKTMCKYNLDSLDKHKPILDSLRYRTLCDTVDHIVYTCKLKVEGEVYLPFRMVINDTELLSDPAFFSDKELNVEQLEKMGLKALADTIQDSQVANIYRIRLLPDGHASSFIKDVNVEVVEDRSTTPPASLFPTPKSKSLLWLWLVIGAVILIAVFVVLFLLKKKREAKIQQEVEAEQRRLAEQKAKENDENKDEEEKGPESPVGEMSESEKVIAKLKKEFEKEREGFAGKIKGLEEEKQKLTGDIAKAKTELEGKVKAAEETITKKFEKEVAKLKEDKDKLSDDLDKEKQEANKRVEAAKKAESEKYEKEIARLKEEKQKLTTSLETEKQEGVKRVEKAREEEKSIAARKIDEINAAHSAVVAKLQQEQKVYTDRLAIVPYATQYAQDINSLIDIVNDINVSAGELANADVDDPYMIFKAIGRFNMAISKIDYEKMLLDVSLAAKDEMSFTDSGITSLKTVSQDQMFTSLRSYFLSSYLEKYINAAVVYNESLAGMDRLVSGLTPQQTAPFNAYRDKLQACFKRLGIAVVSVKLFDKLGDNADLKARMVDFDDSLPADTIIGIENCLVYPEGGRRPQEKIYVVAQK